MQHRSTSVAELAEVSSILFESASQAVVGLAPAELAVL